jgi:hypothetical protein
MVAIIPPPEGMSVAEYDARVLQTADSYPAMLRPYDAVDGPNSNTFVDDTIEMSGGVMPDIPNATGKNYGEIQ